MMGFVFIAASYQMRAQEQPTSVEETVRLAIENNLGLKASRLQLEETEALKALQFDKTTVYYSYDENNLAVNDVPLRVFGVAQEFKFPTVYFADRKVGRLQIKLQETSHHLEVLRLTREVYEVYFQLSYVKTKENVYRYLDSLYQDFAHAAKRRFELGETNYLEMIAAQSKQKQLETVYQQSLLEVDQFAAQLKKLVQVDNITVIDGPLPKLAGRPSTLYDDVKWQYFENALAYRKARWQQEKQNLWPDLSLEYFQGTNDALHKNYVGYQFGLKIPLLFSGNASKIKALKIAQDRVWQEGEDYKLQWQIEQERLLAKLQQYQQAIVYYETQGRRFSGEIVKTAERSLKEGEIDVFQYIQSLEISKDIELTYLDNLNAYNQTIIAINYLILD